MNSSNSPMRSSFAMPTFSPTFTSSPRCMDDSSDFIPLGPGSPGPSKRGRGGWRGRNRSLLSNVSPSFFSNTSTSSGQNSSFSPGMGARSSPYKQNSPHDHGRGRGNKGNYNNLMTNVGAYYHPSMLEDPWIKLEAKLQNSDSCSSSTKTEVENSVRSSDTESVENEQSIKISSQESVVSN